MYIVRLPNHPLERVLFGQPLRSVYGISLSLYQNPFIWEGGAGGLHSKYVGWFLLFFMSQSEVGLIYLGVFIRIKRDWA